MAQPWWRGRRPVGRETTEFARWTQASISGTRQPEQTYGGIFEQMSGRNKDKTAETLGLAVFCSLSVIGVCVLLYILGLLNGGQAERRHQTPAAYSHAAKEDSQRACAGREAATMFECVYERVQAADQTARAEQDLSAQQRAADSALASTALALLTLLVSVTGVWFVKRTLDATLAAVEDTSRATGAMLKQNELAEEQLTQVKHETRAWLAITAEAQKITCIGEAIRFYYSIRVQNVGSTVALDYQLEHAIIDCDGDLLASIDASVQRWSNRRGRNGGVIMPGETVTSNIWSFQAQQNFKQERSGIVYPALLVYVRYRVTSDEDEHVSRRVFRFANRITEANKSVLSPYADPVVLWISLNDGPIIESESLALESSGSYAT